MKPATLEKALFVAFFCGTILIAPERDYDPFFFVWITAPIAIVALLATSARFPIETLYVFPFVGCVVLLGLPLWATGKGLLYLVRREWRAALSYLAVAPIAVCCYFFGRTGADLLVLQSVGPAIQMQIRDARNGKLLPIASESYPFQVSEEPPAMAAYALVGPLFLPAYVVYDPSAATVTNEASRIGIFLGHGACSVDARPIGWHYYYVSPKTLGDAVEDC